jgi:hypothetical protein
LLAERRTIRRCIRRYSSPPRRILTPSETLVRMIHLVKLPRKLPRNQLSAIILYLPSVAAEPISPFYAESYKR